MKTEKIHRLVNEWSTGTYAYGQNCPHCSRIHISTQDRIAEFTGLFEKKLIVGADLVYLCALCGQLYQYTSWMSSPDWGESMKGITEPYEVECLYKRTPAEVIRWVDSVLKSSPGSVKPVQRKTAEKTRSTSKAFRCPECGSFDVDVKIKTEFTRFTCKSCGHWDLLDDWQKDEWRARQ